MALSALNNFSSLELMAQHNCKRHDDEKACEIKDFWREKIRKFTDEMKKA